MKNIKFKKEIKELNKKSKVFLKKREDLNILLEEKENEIQTLKETAVNTYLDEDKEEFQNGD